MCPRQAQHDARDTARRGLRERLTEVPPTLVHGPVAARLQTWSGQHRADARRHVCAVLDGTRYLALLDGLDALLADPPLRPAAGRPPESVFATALHRDRARLAARIETALATGPGPGRDVALHAARKAAKRARYAAEAALPVLGKPAKRFARRVKEVQTLLGEHQDSVMAREAIRRLAAEAADAGEPTFTYGLLYGREEMRATAAERGLADVQARLSLP
ncbi:CHAD domain-containing protein [Streptomyces sp. NPDC049577]|uniref:CHAD domain-containing protein n=1 Tax=Streptomyces sp. NPDC049577 TaxID=3155153 RepID=UPI00343C693E